MPKTGATVVHYSDSTGTEASDNRHLADLLLLCRKAEGNTYKFEPQSQIFQQIYVALSKLHFIRISVDS